MKSTSFALGSPVSVRHRVSAKRAALALLSCTALLLSACGGGNSATPSAALTSDPPALPQPQPQPQPEPISTCTETGAYACRSGETEPLYTFQWALNYAKSFFQTNADGGAYGGGFDLNVEPVHRLGIKGEGIHVLVIDTGVDLKHEDLKDNADYSMSYNFEAGGNDPDPMLTSDRNPHGTNVAGIIGAAQNGIGVMGIAPKVKLGGATLIIRSEEVQTSQNVIDALGGAGWSQKAHVINGSFGTGTDPEIYSIEDSPSIAALRGLKSLRGQKGTVFVKAAGNAFDSQDDGLECGSLQGAYDCTNPANDNSTLEPNVIVTAALNAKGQASSYSSAGSVVWITGLGGEHGQGGRYGEMSGRTAAELAAGATGSGPTIFSTDIRGCSAGYSQKPEPEPNTDFMRGDSELMTGVKDNPNCDYSYMNGTSAATPTITGVVALMLSANPELSWRDVRDILRLSARAVDMGYERRIRKDLDVPLDKPYGARFDLTTNSFTTALGDKGDITAGARQVPMELGWVRNGAGLVHSNWYGFGLPDAAKAVELAQLYKKEPRRSRSSAQIVPSFKPVAVASSTSGLAYQKVTLLAAVSDSTDQIVDEFQLRLTGEAICLGSLGIAVESPAGTMSLLKMPLDHFYHREVADFEKYGLGSYAFYGESTKGTWKIYALASNPEFDGRPTCGAAPADGMTLPASASLVVEARTISQ